VTNSVPHDVGELCIWEAWCNVQLCSENGNDLFRDSNPALSWSNWGKTSKPASVKVSGSQPRICNFIALPLHQSARHKLYTVLPSQLTSSSKWSVQKLNCLTVYPLYADDLSFFSVYPGHLPDTSYSRVCYCILYPFNLYTSCPQFHRIFHPCEPLLV